MKRFIDAAHAHGIGVIVDVVYNHLGPSDIPHWCFDGNCLGNGNGGAYFYTGSKKSTPWGNTRLDYGRPAVRDYVKDNVLMWLQRYRVDGLRFDGTKYMRTVNGDGSEEINDAWTLFGYMNGAAHAEPWKIMIAEDFGNQDKADGITRANGGGFNSQWDGAFVHPVRDSVLNPPFDQGRNMFALRDAVLHTFNGDPWQRVIYTESHDEDSNGRTRVVSEVDRGNPGSWYARKRSTLGAIVMLTAPGIPMLFEGQEYGESEFFAPEHHMHWDKLATPTGGGLFKLYQDVIRLRRNLANKTRGLEGGLTNFYHIDNTNKVVAYHRYSPNGGGAGDDVVVIANFGGKDLPAGYRIGMPRGGDWQVRFNSAASVYGPGFANTDTHVVANGGGQDGLGTSAEVKIGAYSAVILSQ
jgi:1,4-alpha-glucan branching enzyme